MIGRSPKQRPQKHLNGVPAATSFYTARFTKRACYQLLDQHLADAEGNDGAVESLTILEAGKCAGSTAVADSATLAGYRIPDGKNTADRSIHTCARQLNGD